jgi:flavin reductase (DIM6/NTAB) family NADH-FMN oxidoreductase RutF
MPEIDAMTFRRVLGSFATGVTAVAALIEDAPAGIAANSFTSVSLTPPLVSVCIAHSSTSWPMLHRAPHLGVSVLSADQESAARKLAARDTDRFASVRWHAHDNGAVLLDGASAWLICRVSQEIPAGDHDIVLLEVEELGSDHGSAPLVFHGSRFHRLERFDGPS